MKELEYPPALGLRNTNYIWLRLSSFLGLPYGLVKFHIVSDNTLFVMRQSHP